MKNNSKKLIILSILFTSNNILYSVTQLNGEVLFWTSLGTKKFTSISVTSVTRYIIQYIYNHNYKYIYIKMKGFNKNKKIVIRQLKQQSLLNILLISDEISFPHNGCRRSRIRRI